MGEPLIPIAHYGAINPVPVWSWQGICSQSQAPLHPFQGQRRGGCCHLLFCLAASVETAAQGWASRLAFLLPSPSTLQLGDEMQKGRPWFSSVAQSCPTPCDPMDCSTSGFPVHHQFSELAQTHVHWTWWCHPTISSSIIPFSSCLQSFPASGSFLMSQFFTSGGQSIGVSISASVLPMNIQDWFPLGSTGLILQSKGL